MGMFLGFLGSVMQFLINYQGPKTLELSHFIIEIIEGKTEWIKQPSRLLPL